MAPPSTVRLQLPDPCPCGTTTDPAWLSPGSQAMGRHFEHETHRQENRMFAPMAELTGSQSQHCCLLPAFPAVCEGVSVAGSGVSCSHQLWGRAHFLAAQPAGCASWSQQHQPFLPLHNMRLCPPRPPLPSLGTQWVSSQTDWHGSTEKAVLWKAGKPTSWGFSGLATWSSISGTTCKGPLSEDMDCLEESTALGSRAWHWLTHPHPAPG